MKTDCAKGFIIQGNKMEKLRFSRIWLRITAKCVDFVIEDNYRKICSFWLFRHFSATPESGTSFEKTRREISRFKNLLLKKRI